MSKGHSAGLPRPLALNGMIYWTLAAVLFTAATALFFFPTLSTFSSAIIGPPEDNTQFYYFLWYGTAALENPAWDFMYTKMMYAPEGATLYLANYFYYGIGAAWLLKSVLSMVQIYNLLVLSSFVLSGLFATLLIRYLTGYASLSLLGGFIYAFNPSHIGHALHHPTIATIQFIPLFMYFYMRMMREGKKRYLFGAALSWALSALCDWNYLIYGGLFVGCHMIYRIIFNNKNLMKNFAFIFALGGITAALLSPLLFPMIQISLRDLSGASKLPGHDVYVADLLGFVLPSPYHWASGLDWIERWNGLMTGNAWEKSAYLGWANLGIMGAAIPFLVKKHSALVGGLILFMILSMGVSLHVLGESVMPLPHAFLENLPLMEQARNPGRLMAWTYLFLAALVAAAMGHVFGAPQTLKRKAMIGLVSLLILIDFYSPQAAVTGVRMPEAYQVILRDPGAQNNAFTILDLPWDYGRPQMYQTFHQIPSLQGYLGRKTHNTLIGRIPFENENLSIQKEILTEHQVKYIVIHKRKLEHDDHNPEHQTYERFIRALVSAYSGVYETAYEDAEEAVFRVY